MCTMGLWFLSFIECLDYRYRLMVDYVRVFGIVIVWRPIASGLGVMVAYGWLFCA